MLTLTKSRTSDSPLPRSCRSAARRRRSGSARPAGRGADHSFQAVGIDRRAPPSMASAADGPRADASSSAQAGMDLRIALSPNHGVLLLVRQLAGVARAARDGRKARAAVPARGRIHAPEGVGRGVGQLFPRDLPGDQRAEPAPSPGPGWVDAPMWYRPATGVRWPRARRRRWRRGAARRTGRASRCPSTDRRRPGCSSAPPGRPASRRGGRRCARPVRA